MAMKLHVNPQTQSTNYTSQSICVKFQVKKNKNIYIYQ